MSVTIFPNWCKRCGLCAAFCPAKVFDRDASGAPIVARPEKCTTCRMCELRCPDFAILVDDEEAKPK